MSLANDMTRLTEDLEAAQERRLSGVYQDLAQIMADHAKRVDADLKGIFSQAAIIRGRADDLIDQYAAERRRGGARLRGELAEFRSDLRAFVDELLEDYAGKREAGAAYEATVRAAYLEDLRAGVEAALADAERFIGALKRDRLRAARIWQQHARKQSKRRTEMRSPKPVSRPKASSKTKRAKAANPAAASGADQAAG